LQVFDYLYNHDDDYRKSLGFSIDDFAYNESITQYYPYLLYRELDEYISNKFEDDKKILSLIKDFIEIQLDEIFNSKRYIDELLLRYFTNLVKCYIFLYEGHGNVFTHYNTIKDLFNYKNPEITIWLNKLEEDTKIAMLNEDPDELRVLYDFLELEDKRTLFRFNDWLSTSEVENNSNFLNEVKILESLSMYFSNNTIINTRKLLKERVFESVSRNIPEFNSEYTDLVINRLIILGHLFRTDNNISITPPTFIRMRNLNNDVVYYYCGFRTSTFLNKLELLCEDKNIEFIKKQHQVNYKEQYPLSFYIKTESIQDIVGILKDEFPDLHIKYIENGISQDCLDFLKPSKNPEPTVISTAITLEDRQEWDISKGKWKQLTDSIDYKIMRYQLYGQNNFFISNNNEIRKIKSPFLYQIELLFKEGEHCVFYREKDSSFFFDKRIDLPLELRRILVMCNGMLEYEEEAVNIIPLDKNISINPQNTFIKFQNIDQNIIDRMMEIIEEINCNIIKIK
jgi:hypothetical protein